MLVTITEAARLAGVSRQTLYKKLGNGTLSASVDRHGDRAIDTSELLRVFGELKDKQPLTRPVDVSTSTILHGVDDKDGQDGHGLIAALRDQIAILQAQVADARQRETDLMDMLKQRLIADQRPWRWWPWSRKAA